MKILVTGANGYLGRGIVKNLLDMGHQVIAVGTTVNEIDNRAKIFSINIFDVNDPYEYFLKPDVLLHLAWKDGFVHDSTAHLENLSNHLLFLEKFFESKVKRITVMGTMHEIGFYEGSIDENTNTRPMNYYGAAKNSLRNFTEIMAKKYNKKFQWLRAFYIVENTIVGNSIFSKLVEAEKNGENLFPFTTGSNQYDFLDYEDFCYKVAVVVQQDEVIDIINICSGQPVKLSERVEKFINENNFKIKLDYGKYPDRPYDSKAVWGNNEKITNILKNM